MCCGANDVSATDCCAESQPFVYASLSRRDIRSVIFHLLYALEIYEYQESLQGVVDNFNRGFDLDIPLDSEVIRVTQAIINQRDELDEAIKPLLVNWRLERIGICTKIILRLAVWEIKQQEVAASIIINEAIELAKCFAEKDAYKFINGILDEYSKMVAKPESAEPVH